MTQPTEETAKLILAEIARARQYSQLPAPHELFISAETIISGMAMLISPLMEAETAYRQDIVNRMDAGDSHAAAEARARAGSNYADFKRLQFVMDTGEQQTQLIKKFKETLEQEYRRS